MNFLYLFRGIIIFPILILITGCTIIEDVFKDTSAPLVRLACIRVEDPQLIRVSLTEEVIGAITDDDFTVSVNSVPTTISSADRVSGDSGKLLIRIVGTVLSSDSITFSYNPVGERLSDSAGNQLASFDDTIVENYIATEKFYAANLETGGYDIISADLVYQGTRCRIYREQGQEARLTNTLAATLGAEFDNVIYTPILNAFGDPSDVDGNAGKVVILVLDIQDGFTGSGGYVAGFFNPSDTYSKTSVSYSNERDMLYMDSYPGLDGSDTSTFRETMAHELQHLINHNEKVFVQGGKGFDLWINEGMSSAAEKIYAGAQITAKINQFNTGIANVEYGTQFISWSGKLDSYATVYLFFQWLSIHSSEGDSVYRRIMDNSAENYDAVQAAAAATFTGTGAPGAFGELLGAWFIANELNNPTGLYGYKGIITTSPPRYPAFAGTSVSLKPGDGIYRNMSGGVSPSTSSPNIVTYGINTSTGVVDQVPPYSGDVLVVYNKSGVPSRTGVTVSGLPAAVHEAEISVRSLSVLPDRYRVDVQFGDDGYLYLPEQDNNR